MLLTCHVHIHAPPLNIHKFRNKIKKKHSLHPQPLEFWVSKMGVSTFLFLIIVLLCVFVHTCEHGYLWSLEEGTESSGNKLFCDGSRLNGQLNGI